MPDGAQGPSCWWTTTAGLCGLFTDSDLARLIEARRDAALDRPIREVMTAEPITVSAGRPRRRCRRTTARHRISELPVVDGDGKPAGMLDITDLIGINTAADLRLSSLLRGSAHEDAARTLSAPSSY